MDRDFILNSIRDLRGEDVANALSEHAKDVSWVESKNKNIPQFGGGPARGIYQYEIKGTKDGGGASETALNRFYNYISKNNLSIPLEYEDELKNLSNKNNPDFTELSSELQSQIFYADKALGAIPLDKLADGSLSSEDAWVKYHWAGSERKRPDKEKQFASAMRTRPATIKEGSDSVDTQTDKMLSEEQPGGTFRPEDDSVSSDTGVATGDQAEEEPGFLDTVGEYVGDAYDTASEYVSETVNTLERVAESVGEKLRRLLGSEEEQQSSSSNDTPPLPTPRPVAVDIPPLPGRRPERRPVAVDIPPLPGRRPDRTDTPPLPTPRPERTDTPPLPGRRPERRPVAVDIPPLPGRRPKQADVDFSGERSFDDVLDFVNTLKKAEGGSVEKKVKFVKETDTPPPPTPRPSQTKTPSFNVADAAEALYSSATTGSRASARKLRDMVAQQLGVYESSQEATSEAKKYGLNEREVDTLRHILGAGFLKYIGKNSTQPLLQGTELFEKISTYAQRLLDPDSKDKYRKSYYDQSIEEANIDIVNYQVGAALAKQFDKKDDFINYAVELVKELGKGKTPVVVDKMPTRFGLVDRKLTPRLSTGVIYPPEELKRRNLTYNPDRGTLTPPPVRVVFSEGQETKDYGFVEPAPGSNLEDQGPAVLEKAEGGSVEKKVKFVKEDDDDDVPDPPPGATPEEVADDIPAYLSTGEYVLPANVVRYIGLKNITGMHQRALSELQQMEDLDIIENVDENGYVEEDDDEMDYMEPEEAGVVEIVVAEHHPKGLMAMGFAEGGPIEAMVYVPGVGFVPQSQAAARPSQKKTDEDTRAETREGPSGKGGTDTDKSMSEMSPMEQAAFGETLSGPLGGAIEAISKGIVGSALGLASPLGVETAFSLATGVPTAAQQAMKSVEEDIAKAKEMYAMSPAELAAAQDAWSGPVTSAFGATEQQVQSHAEAVAAGNAPAGSHANAAGGYSTKGEFGFSTSTIGKEMDDVVGNDPDRNGIPGDQTGKSAAAAAADKAAADKAEAAADAEAEAAADAEAEAAAAELKRGGYVTRNGIMAKGFSQGGDPGPGDGHGGGSREPVEDLEPEVIEEEKPTDPYGGYTYVKGIGYVPTSRRATSNKPIESASLALSSIFTPGFLETIGLMSDPNKEL
jgi:hypothetical protein